MPCPAAWYLKESVYDRGDLSILHQAQKSRDFHVDFRRASALAALLSKYAKGVYPGHGADIVGRLMKYESAFEEFKGLAVELWTCLKTQYRFMRAFMSLVNHGLVDLEGLKEPIELYCEPLNGKVEWLQSTIIWAFPDFREAPGYDVFCRWLATLVVRGCLVANQREVIEHLRSRPDLLGKVVYEERENLYHGHGSMIVRNPQANLVGEPPKPKIAVPAFVLPHGLGYVPTNIDVTWAGFCREFDEADLLMRKFFRLGPFRDYAL